MKPSIGRILVIKGITSNGSDEHPAIVTRAWSDAMVNVHVLPDSAPATSRSSVPVVQDRAAAEQYLSRNPGSVVCFWPERV